MAYRGFSTNRHPEGHPLKYYRVVRKMLSRSNDLTEAELEKLIFLDNEYFTKTRFGEASCMDWSWNPNQFKELIEKGWIEEWRPYKPPYQAALFRSTGKAHQLVKRVYRILAEEEDLPMSSRRNPVMRKTENLSSSDKLLKRAVMLMQNDKYKDRYE